MHKPKAISPSSGLFSDSTVTHLPRDGFSRSPRAILTGFETTALVEWLQAHTAATDRSADHNSMQFS